MLSLDAIRTRLAAERGFTLIELMVSISLGMLVLFAVTNLLDSSGRANARLTDKTETVQRIRIGMDRVTRVLRTQVCPDTATPPIISGTPTAVSFYSDLSTTGDERFRPRKVSLYMISADGGTVIQDTYVPTSASAPWTYAATPTSTTDLVNQVTGLGGSTDIFKYYGFADTNNEVATPLDTSLSADPLPSNSIAKIVKVDASLQVSPQSGNTDTRRKAAMTGSVYTRNADFSGGGNTGRNWGPRCG